MSVLYCLYQVSVFIAPKAQYGKTWVNIFSTHLSVSSLLTSIFLTQPDNYFQFTLIFLGSLSPFRSSALYYVFVIQSFEKFSHLTFTNTPQSMTDCTFKDGHTNISYSIKSYSIMLTKKWRSMFVTFEFLWDWKYGRCYSMTSEARTKKMVELLPSFLSFKTCALRALSWHVRTSALLKW